MTTNVLGNGVTVATGALAKNIICGEEYLYCHLADGRIIHVPMSWYPRLKNATPEARADWELIAGGMGIHWPQLDEDLSVAGFLAGGEW